MNVDMRKTEKRGLEMKRRIIISLFCMVFILFASAGCSKEIPNRLNWEVEDFTYTDQDGEKFSLAHLRGKVWVADFIFTNCSTVCPPMTANMAKLKELVEKEKLDVHFVSFSVDPEVDTPDRLKEYGKKFTDDLSNWTFLTGYSQEEIIRMVRNSFKAIVEKEEGNNQVGHATYFYLVDQEGKIVRYYKGEKDVPYEEIVEHIKMIQE
jgi:protein SCO1/2